MLWDLGSSSPRVGGDAVGADLPPTQPRSCGCPSEPPKASGQNYVSMVTEGPCCLLPLQTVPILLENQPPDRAMPSRYCFLSSPGPQLPIKPQCIEGSWPLYTEANPSFRK